MSESQSEAVGPAAEALVQQVGGSARGASCPSTRCVGTGQPLGSRVTWEGMEIC